MVQRFDLAAPYLRGHGLEIGAGPYPHPLPPDCRVTHFDKRSTAELQEYFKNTDQNTVQPITEAGQHFPDGAAFLIAHHVAEHSPDVIGTLIEWMRLLAEGGVMVLSLPMASRTPDRGRLIPSIHHLVEDYLLNRNEDSFESREHIYSFVAGWIDDGFCKPLDKFGVAKGAHDNAHAPNNDLHWHAFDAQLGHDALTAAAWLGGFRTVALATKLPAADDPTDNEATWILRVHRQPPQARTSALVSMAQAYRAMLTAELTTSVLEGLPLASRSPELDGRIYLCRDGRRHWISSPATFDRLGLSWTDVRYLPARELLAIPEGAAL